jgi:hypothetical protein
MATPLQKGETKHGNKQTTKGLHGSAFMGMALSNNARA